MIHVGVDIAKYRHAAAAVNDAGEVVMQPRFLANDAAGFASFSGALRKLGGPEAVAVGMEATGHYWKVFRHACAGHGYRTDVINPLITSREASADVRGRKSDKTEALAIAHVLRKGGYSPAPAAQPATDTLKALARHRRALVERCSDAKLRLVAALDVAFPGLEKLLGDLFSVSSLAVIRAFPSSRLAAGADIRTLASVFRKASGGQLGQEAAGEFRKAARRSLSLTMDTGGEEFVIPQIVDEIRAASARIDAVEKRMLEEPRPVVATLLGSIKGAGRIQPLVIAAEIGDISRFAGPDMEKRLLAYSGCDPRVRESGKWKGTTRMSRRGSPTLRNALYLMAGTIRLHTPCFNAIYKQHIGKGKHHCVAISHVINKILDVLCGMYRTNTLFAPPKTEVMPC